MFSINTKYYTRTLSAITVHVLQVGIHCDVVHFWKLFFDECWCVLLVCIVGVYCWCVVLVCIVGVYCWCVLLVCIVGVYCWCVLLVRIVACGSVE